MFRPANRRPQPLIPTISIVTSTSTQWSTSSNKCQKMRSAPDRVPNIQTGPEVTLVLSVKIPNSLLWNLEKPPTLPLTASSTSTTLQITQDHSSRLSAKNAGHTSSTSPITHYLNRPTTTRSALRSTAIENTSPKYSPLN